MKILKIIIPVILFFIGMSSVLVSQSISVNFSDTLIDRGIVSIIPARMNLSPAQTGKLTLKFGFNAKVLDIKPLTVNPPENINYDVENTSLDMTDLENAVYTVDLNLKTVLTGFALQLKIEGLVGKDTVSSFKLNEAILNGKIAEIGSSVAGKIIVRSSSVVPGITEGLGLNRPNPFDSWTTFPIGLNKESAISFKIFGTDGRCLYSDNDLLNMFNVSLLDESNSEIGDYRGKILPRGIYRLSFNPDPMTLASGNYFIVLTTVSGVYKQNFMYVK